MDTEYYIISKGERRGPYSIESIRQMGISPDTMVWRQGMADWEPASKVTELADMFPPSETPFSNSTDARWYAMIDGQRIGPFDTHNMAAQGINDNTPVWRQGMTDWAPAHTCPELMNAINARRASEPPKVPEFNPYRYAAGGNYDSINNGTGYPTSYFNWMPWAVAATVAAFLFSCIGVVFGIIGIVQANKANEAYASSNYAVGDQANSTARTMTLVAMVFAGVGLIGSVIAFLSGIF